MFCGLSLESFPTFQVVFPRSGSSGNSVALSLFMKSTNFSTALSPYCGYPEWKLFPFIVILNDLVPLLAETIFPSVGSPTIT